VGALAAGSAETALDDPDALDGPGRAARAAFEGALVDGGWLSAGAAVGPGAAGPVVVRVNATVDAVAVEEAVAAAIRAAADGFRTLKLKAPPKEATGALARRVTAVRDAVAPDVRLRLDANGAWSVVEARERFDALAPLGLEYVEEPVATLAELVELAEVRAGSAVLLAADEIVASPAAAEAVLDARAADVLVVKPARVGGPLQALRIAEMAAARGVPVVVSTLLETGIGLGATLRTASLLPVGPAHGLATAGLLVSDLLIRSLAIRDGSMAVPRPDAWPRPDDAMIRRFAESSLGTPW
jgi:O-succinylbenzoate synthase